ncbi:MAG TPA: carbohydrate ABC transporter permease, partial [Bacilli bacterium]
YLFISNEKLLPLQTILQKIILANQASMQMPALVSESDIVTSRVTPYSVQIATMMISVGPIVLIYPFFQKYFVKGFMIGSIKE